jgi:hypothetical protein
MIDVAINKVRGAIEMADRIGAYEITEELEPLLEALLRRKCRMDMELNGMTGYCLPGCCANWDDCHQENDFDKNGVNIADHANRNWFDNTGDQPSKPVMRAG